MCYTEHSRQKAFGSPGLENLFRREGFTVHSASGYEAAAAAAGRCTLDVALIDIRLKGTKNGLELLKELKRVEPDLVVIVITGFGSIDTAVSALKGGAADYFLKPIDNTKLLDAVRKSLQLRALATENRYLRDELNRRSMPHHFITKDPAVRELISTADKVKDTNVTVLITGESGTGQGSAGAAHPLYRRSQGRDFRVHQLRGT